MKGTVFLVPIAKDKCVHIIDLYLNFGNYGVSGLVTQIMIDELKKCYRMIPECVADWIKNNPRNSSNSNSSK